MKKTITGLVATLLLLALSQLSIAQETDPQVSPYAGAPGREETRTGRMAWFQDAKFPFSR